MATKSISQLNTIGQLNDGDLFEVAHPDTGSSTGYVSGRESIAQVGDYIAKNLALTGLDTEADTLVGAVNELKAENETTVSNIADAYDDTATYSEGDYCIYNGVLYKCNTDILVAESFDSTKWDATTVFRCVSDGKELVADAITDKGIPTSATDTFQTMADNIAQISGGFTTLEIPTANIKVVNTSSYYDTQTSSWLTLSAIYGTDEINTVWTYTATANGQLHFASNSVAVSNTGSDEGYIQITKNGTIVFKQYLATLYIVQLTGMPSYIDFNAGDIITIDFGFDNAHTNCWWDLYSSYAITT